MSHSSLVAAAVRPTAQDLTEVRALVIQALSASTSMSMSELEEVVYQARAVPAVSSTDRVRFEGHSQINAAVFDNTHPIIVRKRLQFALRETLGALFADGALVAAAGDHSGNAEDFVRGANDSWRGTITFRHDYTPAPQGRVKLNSAPTHRMELASATLVDDMRDLLGPRGSEVLAEAIRCYHRGFFIAAVDLLAATSEAAWFGIAAVITTDTKLVRLVAAGSNAAEVISRTREAISHSGVSDRHALNDLHAQAARLRDLRNYGVHPVGAPDQDREPAFTEAGCAVLFMSSPRYLRQLDIIRRGLADHMSTSTAPHG